MGKRLLAFIFRTNPIKSTSTNTPHPQFGYLLTPDQYRLVRAIAIIVDITEDTFDLSPEGLKEREWAEKRLITLVIELYIALFNHRLGRALSESALVIFLAVLGIDSTNNSFHPPEQYTSNLSALVKLTQLIVLQYSLNQASGAPNTALADYIKPLKDEFMISTCSTPFILVLRLRAEGKRIRNITTQDGYITWADDYSSLSYKETTLSLERFRSFILKEIELLSLDLKRLLLINQNTPAPPEFDLTQFIDSPANRSTGWCFIDEPKNELGQFKQFLTSKILASPSLRAQFLKKEIENRAEKALGELEGGASVWQANRVKSYILIETRFLTRLGLLILILSGQPLRGTELTSIRLRNTITGGGRNILIEGGLVSIVTLYHKGYSIGGTTKTIYRYLPKQLSQLFVSYLVLVLPFTQYLRQALYKTPSSPFLWARTGGRTALGQPWDTTIFTELLKAETKQYLGDY